MTLARPDAQKEASSRVHRALTAQLASNLEKSLIQKTSQLIATMDCSLTAVRARLGHELYEEGEIPLSPEAMFFFKKMRKAFVEAEEGYHQGHTEILHHRVATGISAADLTSEQLKTMKLAQHAVDDLPIMSTEQETGAEMAVRTSVGDLEIQCQEDQLCEEVNGARRRASSPSSLELGRRTREHSLDSFLQR